MVLVVQPPFRVTGDANLDWMILCVGLVVCLYWLRALRLAREGARNFLASLLIAGLAWLGGVAYLIHNYPWTIEQDEVLVGIGAMALLLILLGLRRRSRYIPASTRRAVIARDLKGKPFDPRRQHIDHIWPYSRGGSNTIDNLRMIDKAQNLKKRAKRPRIWEMWN
jgi:hypothetical protein